MILNTGRFKCFLKRCIRKLLNSGCHSVRGIDCTENSSPTFVTLTLFIPYLTSNRCRPFPYQFLLIPTHPPRTDSRESQSRTFHIFALAYTDRALYSHPGIHRDAVCLHRPPAPEQHGVPTARFPNCFLKSSRTYI